MILRFGRTIISVQAVRQQNPKFSPHSARWDSIVRWSFCAAGKKILRILSSIWCDFPLPQVFEWKFLGTPSVWTEIFLAASRPNHANSWGPQVFEQNVLGGQVFELQMLRNSQIATFIFSVLSSWGRLGSKQRGGRSLGVGSITWNPPDLALRLITMFCQNSNTINCKFLNILGIRTWRASPPHALQGWFWYFLKNGISH